MAVDPGNFNFNQIMRDFMALSPTETDSEGRSYKLGVAADMVTSGYDSELASKMGAEQALLSKEMMQEQARLERQGASQAREDQFVKSGLMSCDWSTR